MQQGAFELYTAANAVLVVGCAAILRAHRKDRAWQIGALFVLAGALIGWRESFSVVDRVGVIHEGNLNGTLASIRGIPHAGAAWDWYQHVARLTFGDGAPALESVARFGAILTYTTIGGATACARILGKLSWVQTAFVAVALLFGHDWLRAMAYTEGPGDLIAFYTLAIAIAFPGAHGPLDGTRRPGSERRAAALVTLVASFLLLQTRTELGMITAPLAVSALATAIGRERWMHRLGDALRRLVLLGARWPLITLALFGAYGGALVLIGPQLHAHFPVHVEFLLHGANLAPPYFARVIPLLFMWGSFTFGSLALLGWFTLTKHPTFGGFVVFTIPWVCGMYVVAGHGSAQEYYRYTAMLGGAWMLLVAVGVGAFAARFNALSDNTRRVVALAWLIGLLPTWPAGNMFGHTLVREHPNTAKQLDAYELLHTMEEHPTCAIVAPVSGEVGAPEWQMIWRNEIVEGITGPDHAMAVFDWWSSGTDLDCLVYFRGMDCQLISSTRTDIDASYCGTNTPAECPELGTPYRERVLALDRYSDPHFGCLPTIYSVTQTFLVPPPAVAHPGYPDGQRVRGEVPSSAPPNPVATDGSEDGDAAAAPENGDATPATDAR